MDRYDYDSVSLLLQQARKGCSQSRDELIDQFQSYLLLIAKRTSDNDLQHKLGNSDIVQQTVLNAIRGFDSFDGTSRLEFKAWLKQILINEIRNTGRDLRRQKRDVFRERQLDRSENGLKNQLVDTDPTPHSAAAGNEMAARLSAALEQLPEDHRTVVRLRSFDRMPFEQIAEKIGRTRDATAKLWYRALVRLQSLIGGEDDRRTD
ncbi:MAG: sigma-70 family RNA polymerase sigma factor [Planctomycetota bacterium]